MVDGLGRLRRVSATEDPELFWALRGGGGDFGIITRMEVALHPAPEVYGGRLLWPVEQMGEVLRTFRAVTESAPEELTVWYHTYQFPPFPEIPSPSAARRSPSIAVAYLGGRRGRRGAVAPFRAIPGWPWTCWARCRWPSSAGSPTSRPTRRRASSGRRC